MNKEEHRQCHVALHEALDELVADFINHTTGRPGITTINELIYWSYRQTIEPREASGRNGDIPLGWVGVPGSKGEEEEEKC